MKNIIIIGVLFLLYACSHADPMVSVHIDETRTPHVLSFSIQDSYQTAPSVEMRLFPKYTSTRLIELPNKLQQVQPGVYQMVLPELAADQYRVVIDLSYPRDVLGIPFGKSIHQFKYDFVLHNNLPASCFRFENKTNDIMGWTTHGVYLNNRDERVGKETCPGLFYVNISWPYPLNETAQGGSLFVPVSSECFPKTSPQLSETSLWRFTFISPDLTSEMQWQDLRAIHFMMATKSIPVTVTPEVEYIVNQQTQSTLAGSNKPKRYPVSIGHWGEVQHKVEIPHNATITRIHFHITGQPEKTVTDKVDSIFLDAICPVK